MDTTFPSHTDSQTVTMQIARSHGGLPCMHAICMVMDKKGGKLTNHSWVPRLWTVHACIGFAACTVRDPPIRADQQPSFLSSGLQNMSCFVFRLTSAMPTNDCLRIPHAVPLSTLSHSLAHFLPDHHYN